MASSEGLPRLADGRSYITDEQVAENPELLAMVRRQGGFWKRDDLARIWVGQPPLMTQEEMLEFTEKYGRPEDVFPLVVPLEKA